MAYVDRNRLNNAVTFSVVASIYWFLVICRLLFYYIRGS